MWACRAGATLKWSNRVLLLQSIQLSSLAPSILALDPWSSSPCPLFHATLHRLLCSVLLLFLLDKGLLQYFFLSLPITVPRHTLNGGTVPGCRP